MTRVFIFLLLFFLQAGTPEKAIRIKGISVEAPKSSVTAETLRPIAQLGANWVSIMPYAFARHGSPDIQFNSTWQWRGERTEGVVESIQAARANGLQVMLKPHLWIHDQFTGDVTFGSEEEWKRWEKSYADYVLYYAQLAEQHKVAMYCIGTELKEFVRLRPVFWIKLIQDVRRVYSGQLTYAANWDNFQRIPFWDKLDFIGVDAYFPLSEEKKPTPAQLTAGWKPWAEAMKKLSQQVHREVVFTEIGYRSMDYCAREPWVSYEDHGAENQHAQSTCIEAYFTLLEQYPFIVGGFLWKWHTPEHMPAQGNKDFTFQQKAAERMIGSYY